MAGHIFMIDFGLLILFYNLEVDKYKIKLSKF